MRAAVKKKEHWEFEDLMQIANFRHLKIPGFHQFTRHGDSNETVNNEPTRLHTAVKKKEHWEFEDLMQIANFRHLKIPGFHQFTRHGDSNETVNNEPTRLHTLRSICKRRHQNRPSVYSVRSAPHPRPIPMPHVLQTPRSS
ncbi:hypothetical protein ACLOJK_009999 [Asimina triloba]